MMLAVNNKLPQPPNASWQALPPPYGEQVAFTDSTKQYAWIGYVADENAPLPVLRANANVPTDQIPAFWSHLVDQS